MRAVVQRAAWARVTVDGEIVGSLDGPGLVVLLGVTNGDGEKEALAMASKLWMLRIMRDAEGRMNRSVADIGGGLLVISQFTLYGDASKGRRPSFVAAAPGEVAEPLVDRVVEHLRISGARVETGRFGLAQFVVVRGPHCRHLVDALQPCFGQSFGCDAGQVTPRNTGSSASVIPKRSATVSRTCTARRIRSAVQPPP